METYLTNYTFQFGSLGFRNLAAFCELHANPQTQIVLALVLIHCLILTQTFCKPRFITAYWAGITNWDLNNDYLMLKYSSCKVRIHSRSTVFLLLRSATVNCYYHLGKCENCTTAGNANILFIINLVGSVNFSTVLARYPNALNGKKSLICRIIGTHHFIILSDILE